MKRTRTQIRQEAIDLLSNGEYILSDFTRELRINTNMAAEILQDLDKKGILEKNRKPSLHRNHLCIHYCISKEVR